MQIVLVLIGLYVSIIPLLSYVNPVKAENVDYTLEEVVVTAERRERNPQRVPLSLTVLSGAELDAASIENTFDLQYRVPGFEMKTNSLLGQPYIRGVGSDLITVGTDPAVATFVDAVGQILADSRPWKRVGHRRFA